MNLFVRYVRIIVALIAILESSKAQESCSASSKDTQGSCVSIRECPSLLSLLSKPETIGERERETLRKSQCGFVGTVPKVCCPKIPEPQESTSPSTEPEIPSPPDVTNHANLGSINSDNCGAITESRIIGGNRTKFTEFPWMALIAYKIDGQGSNQFGCGGSLITKRYVLTAAHCVTALSFGLEVSGVRLGDHDISREEDCEMKDGVTSICTEKYEDFLIEKFHFHKDYVKKTHRNDIALIRIDRDADLTRSNIKPICLPVGNAANLNSTKVIVTGWGTTETGLRSDILLKVKLQIFPTDQCSDIYLNENGIKVWYKQLCAGGYSMMDSCTGDSGGPLQFPNIIKNQPKYVQYGIVGFGPQGCGIIGTPGVYTKVVYYMDWILDNIAE